MIHRHPKNSPHVLLPRLFHTKNHCKGSLTLLLVSVFTSEPFIYVVFFFFSMNYFNTSHKRLKIGWQLVVVNQWGEVFIGNAVLFWTCVHVYLKRAGIILAGR